MRVAVPLAALAASIFYTSSAEAYCPAGSWQVNVGGAIMCQCPDGSYAGYQGCPYRAPPRPQCLPGQWYSSIGCIPVGAEVCSTGGWCNPGSRCWNSSGKTVCMPAQQAFALEHGARLAKWLRENRATLVGTVKERHAKGAEYVRDNPEVRQALEDLERVAAGYAVGGVAGNPRVGAELAGFYNSVKAAERAGELLATNQYEGSIALVHLYSSAILDRVPGVPPGSSEVLTLAGATATAYAYGFFFAP